MAAAKNRKGWDQLSPAYRKRLERGGVTKSQYESGTGTLAKARGHGSATQENTRAKFLKSKAAFARKMSKATGYDYDEVYEELDSSHFSDHEVEMLIDMQANLQTLYQAGRHEEATRTFVSFATQHSVPWWIIAYHGRII